MQHLMLTVEVMPGTTIVEAVREAIDLANRVGCYIEINFNGHSLVIHAGSEESKVLGLFHDMMTKSE